VTGAFQSVAEVLRPGKIPQHRNTSATLLFAKCCGEKRNEISVVGVARNTATLLLK